MCFQIYLFFQNKNKKDKYMIDWGYFEKIIYFLMKKK